MKLYSEEQILDEKVRKEIISEINSGNNKARKMEAKKRHDVLKDNAVKYVLKKLENEGLKQETLQIMQNRAANISICRKIISKLARAYSYGLVRETQVEELTATVSFLATYLGFDSKMKKADRYLRLQRNCLPWFIPEPTEPGKWCIKMKVFAPYQYDAVENVRDPDCPLAIVLSDFYSPHDISGNIRGGKNQVTYTDSEGTQWTTEKNKIASTAAVVNSEDAKTYIWWGNKYHFTTDKDGKILASMSPLDNLNPIQTLPGVPLAIDRDDSFWAGGGQDIADNSVLINTIITDINAILFMQGWGQMVVTAPKGSIPTQLEGGPHQALVFTFDEKKGEGRPEVTVVSSNPPIDSWMRSVEQLTALLLSTNNLSPKTVAAKLDAQSAASGISMLIDRSESSEDITDSQGEFAKAERKAWRIYAKWHNLYLKTKSLDDELAAVGVLPEDIDVTCKFHPGQEVLQESERLDNMKKKKELGIVRQIELIMEENPGMTEEDAQKKLLEIKAEAAERAVTESAQFADKQKAAMGGGQPGPGTANPGPNQTSQGN